MAMFGESEEKMRLIAGSSVTIDGKTAGESNRNRYSNRIDNRGIHHWYHIAPPTGVASPTCRQEDEVALRYQSWYQEYRRGSTEGNGCVVIFTHFFRRLVAITI